MCSGSRGTTALRTEQTRLANISKIKSQQATRKGKINVVMGGGTDDYRRSISTGAKTVGETAGQLQGKKMSKLFTKNKGQADWKALLRKYSPKGSFLGGGNQGGSGGSFGGAPDSPGMG